MYDASGVRGVATEETRWILRVDFHPTVVNNGSVRCRTSVVCRTGDHKQSRTKMGAT
jgi:hypothetical protein